MDVPIFKPQWHSSIPRGLSHHTRSAPLRLRACMLLRHPRSPAALSASVLSRRRRIRSPTSWPLPKGLDLTLNVVGGRLFLLQVPNLHRGYSRNGCTTPRRNLPGGADKSALYQGLHVVKPPAPWPSETGLRAEPEASAPNPFILYGGVRLR